MKSLALKIVLISFALGLVVNIMSCTPNGRTRYRRSRLTNNKYNSSTTTKKKKTKRRRKKRFSCKDFTIEL